VAEPAKLRDAAIETWLTLWGERVQRDADGWRSYLRSIEEYARGCADWPPEERALELWQLSNYFRGRAETAVEEHGLDPYPEEAYAPGELSASAAWSWLECVFWGAAQNELTDLQLENPAWALKDNPAAFAQAWGRIGDEALEILESFPLFPFLVAEDDQAGQHIKWLANTSAAGYVRQRISFKKSPKLRAAAETLARENGWTPYGSPGPPWPRQTLRPLIAEQTPLTWARVRADYLEDNRLPMGALGGMRRTEDDLIKAAKDIKALEGESLDAAEEDEEGELGFSLEETFQQSEGDGVWSLRYGDGDPATLVADSSDRRVLKAAMVEAWSSLTEAERKAIKAAYIPGWRSYDEVDHSATRKQRSRGVAKLRGALKRWGFDRSRVVGAAGLYKGRKHSAQPCISSSFSRFFGTGPDHEWTLSMNVEISMSQSGGKFPCSSRGQA